MVKTKAMSELLKGTCRHRRRKKKKMKTNIKMPVMGEELRGVETDKQERPKAGKRNPQRVTSLHSASESASGFRLRERPASKH